MRAARVSTEVAGCVSRCHSGPIIAPPDNPAMAIREILKTPESYARVGAVLLIDGMHADYVDGKPGPLESKLGGAS